MPPVRNGKPQNVVKLPVSPQQRGCPIEIILDGNPYLVEMRMSVIYEIREITGIDLYSQNLFDENGKLHEPLTSPIENLPKVMMALLRYHQPEMTVEQVTDMMNFSAAGLSYYTAILMAVFLGQLPAETEVKEFQDEFGERPKEPRPTQEETPSSDSGLTADII